MEIKINRKYFIISAIIIAGFFAIILFSFVVGVIFYEFGYRFENREPPLPVRVLFPFFLFTGGILIGLIIVWYYYPEIRPSNRNDSGLLSTKPIDVVRYISSDDEVKVIDAIQKLPNGAYQFEISNLSTLPRMKVHRVVKKLVERDILLRMEPKDGESKNSKYFLAEWLINHSNGKK